MTSQHLFIQLGTTKLWDRSKVHTIDKFNAKSLKKCGSREDASKKTELLPQAMLECKLALNLQPEDKDNIALMGDIMDQVKPMFHVLGESQIH